MSKRTNPAVIGAFVIGSLSLVVAMAVALGGGHLFRETMPYVLFFDGSVKGLHVGAPVMFRGVQVGAVTDIRLNIDPEDLTVAIPVFIEVDPARIGTPDGKAIRHGNTEDVRAMIRRGLRARLEMQSLVTGQLAVQFDFYPDAPLNLTGMDLGVMELPTIPTPMQEMARAFHSMDLPGLVEKISTALDDLSTVLASPEMARGLRAVPAILEETRDLVRDLRRDVAPVLERADSTLQDASVLLRNLDRRTEAVSGELQGALGDTRGLVRQVSGQVEPLAENLNRVLDKGSAVLGDTDRAVNDLAGSAGGALERLDGVLVRAEANLAKIGKVLDTEPQLRHELLAAMREIASAARSVRVLADLLQRHPDALLRGKTTGGGR